MGIKTAISCSALCGAALSGAALSGAATIEKIDTNFKAVQGSASEISIKWHDVTNSPVRIGGFCFFQNEKIFRRMPLNPPEQLPPGVESLAWHTSGGNLSFKTDSREIHVRIKLRPFKFMNMGPSAQSGVDLYRKTADCWIYAGSGGPSYNDPEGYERRLFRISQKKLMEYRIHFPIYHGVEKFEIGLEKGAKLLPPTPWSRAGKVVVYGGSTLQGARASRPGNTWTSQVSRTLNLEFANMGFSGSGRTESSVAKSFCLIPDPVMFIMCSDTNSTIVQLKERFDTFIAILRKKFPEVPILVYTRPGWGIDLRGDLDINANRLKERKEKEDYLESRVRAMRRKGDKNISFMRGAANLSNEQISFATADGSHMNDYGFLLTAEKIAPVIRRILNK